MTIKAELINPDGLTPRQGQIAELMAEGCSNKVIARKLAIGIRTVDTHIASIYEKLGLRSKSINTRCTAILTMVARGMIALSIRSVVMVLVFNAAQLDDSALRVKGGQVRVGVSRMRRSDDA
jgi:DNA-binding CsgD family transcriptional regulator